MFVWLSFCLHQHWASYWHAPSELMRKQEAWQKQQPYLHSLTGQTSPTLRKGDSAGCTVKIKGPNLQQECVFLRACPKIKLRSALWHHTSAHTIFQLSLFPQTLQEIMLMLSTGRPASCCKTLGSCLGLTSI